MCAANIIVQFSSQSDEDAVEGGGDDEAGGEVEVVEETGEDCFEVDEEEEVSDEGDVEKEDEVLES